MVAVTFEDLKVKLKNASFGSCTQNTRYLRINSIYLFFAGNSPAIFLVYSANYSEDLPARLFNSWIFALGHLFRASSPSAIHFIHLPSRLSIPWSIIFEMINLRGSADGNWAPFDKNSFQLNCVMLQTDYRARECKI